MASENGKLFGMIGMVARKEVDVAVGGLALYHSRLNSVDFLGPLLTDKYVQIYRSDVKMIYPLLLLKGRTWVIREYVAEEDIWV